MKWPNPQAMKSSGTRASMSASSSPHRTPMSSKPCIITRHASLCMSAQFVPGFIVASTASTASSTAWYTQRWSGVNTPFAGNELVMSEQ